MWAGATGFTRSNSRQFESADFETLIGLLGRLESWIATHGIKRRPNDRLAAYTEDIRRLADANAAGAETLTRFWRERGPEHLCNALVEGAEWAEIYSAFGTRVEKEIGRRLRECLAGPGLYREEVASTSSNRGRDIQAELAIAAVLASQGVSEIQFTPEGDFSFVLAGRLVYVEAKRPGSTSQIRKRLREAGQQLRHRYRGSALDCSGLIGISVSKLLNPQGARGKFSRWEDLDRGLRQLSDDFVRRYERHWLTQGEQTLGCLIQFRGGAYVTEAPWFAPAVVFSFSYRDDLPDAQLRLTRRLRDQIGGGGLLLPRRERHGQPFAQPPYRSGNLAHSETKHGEHRPRATRWAVDRWARAVPPVAYTAPTGPIWSKADLGGPCGSARKIIRKWSRWPDSNRRPADYESAALPTELHRREGCCGAESCASPTEVYRPTDSLPGDETRFLEPADCLPVGC
jgi:hypothetical protein